MIIVGHRGARNEAPENTVAGFVHAQQHGCEYFELDVQLSSDHQLMVFHDTSLKRTTGYRKKMTSCESGFLKQLDARLNTPGWPEPAPVPTLQEVLDSAPHVKHWQFEVKPDSRTRLIIIANRLNQLIQERGLEQCATITSSSRWLLSYLKSSVNSKVSTGLVAEWPLPEPVATASDLGCDYLCVHHSLATPDLIARAHEKAMHVSVWTVNDLQHMHELEDAGVDSIITDIPSRALAHYQSVSA